MGMGIGGFYRQAVAKDFSRDFQMRVVSIGPGVLNQNDNVYITTASLPGYSVHNITAPFMGMTFNVPGGGHFPGSDAWTVQFRCDVNLNIREKLITWQQSVFNAFPDTPGESTGAYGPKYTETTAELTIFDTQGNEVKGLRLVGVWPVSVPDVGYDNTGTGQIQTKDVVLAYQWWEPYSIGKVIP